MNEKLIRKLSLFCSVIGLVALSIGAAVVRPRNVAISNLSEEFLGTGVVVSGKVVGLREHPNNHLFLTLEDESGSRIAVPIFARIRSELNERVELLDRVQVSGTVGEFRGKLQVVPEGAGDIRVFRTAPTRIADLGEKDLNGLVKVEGVVIRKRTVGRGSLILTLAGENSELPIFVPASVVERGLPELRIGSRVRVGGLFQLYRGRPQLLLRNTAWLHVIGAA